MPVDEARTVGPSGSRFGSYTSPRSSLRLRTHNEEQYTQRMLEQAAQRKLERELYAVAVLEEHERREQERKERERKARERRANATPRKDPQAAAPSDAPATTEGAAADQPAGEGSSEPKNDGANAAGDEKPAKPKLTKEERKKRRAKRKEERAKQTATYDRLARQPKPPQTPPACRPRTAPAPKISDEEFAKRLYYGQVRAMQARRTKTEQKYEPKGLHTPRINPPRDGDGESSPGPADWESISARLYTQDVHTRKQHLAKLTERLAPKPPQSARLETDVDTLADRLYRRGMQREKSKIAAAAEREEQRWKETQIFRNKKTTDEQWRQRLNGKFASPR